MKAWLFFKYADEDFDTPLRHGLVIENNFLRSFE